MATIKEVAEYAGVSVATVSRVVNNTGRVSPELRRRVLAAMDALNYQPSALARSLRRRRTQTVGILVPQLDHPFFSSLAFAIERKLFSEHYHALICSAEENQEKEDAYIEMLIRQRVNGVILVPTGQSAENVHRLLEQQVPVVLADRDLPDLAISRVLNDNFHGGYEGARHLLSLGHRRIGVIGGPDYSYPMRQRINGIRQAFRDARVAHDPDLMSIGTLQQFEMGYTAARSLLSKSPRPTAIFALTDVMAVGVLHAAYEEGLRLPEELSVMGFDDIPLASYSIPELTTIAQPIYDMGESAARILLRQMQKPDSPVESVMLQTRLIVRQSTVPPPA